MILFAADLEMGFETFEASFEEWRRGLAGGLATGCLSFETLTGEQHFTESWTGLRASVDSVAVVSQREST